MMKRSSVFQFSRRPSYSMMGALCALGLASSLLLPEVVQAQSPGDIAQYTKVAQQIERQRMKLYSEVKQKMGGNVPENVCQQGNLPPDVRKICDEFDSVSRDIITSNGMTVGKFNEVFRFCQQSPKPKDCPR
ncbi:MAG: DUF4168 domain-containing protein [Leptolyngbyaceae cyanobacterium bins.302]|nr:DUF4168 domain-containing protein [Leptolyngbyaceae cyanobacterium bins.302]